MELKEAQERVDAWITSFEEGYWPALDILARMVEEMGELARELNHRLGSKPKRPEEPEQDLAIEIGDVLFVLITLANSQEIDLDDALERVLSKYEERDGARWTPKRARETGSR